MSGDEKANGHLNGSNGAAHHDDDDGDELSEAFAVPPPPEPVGPPPASVSELIAACQRFVASKYKVALDGTPETLSLVDQYVREARTAYGERPESIDLVAPAVGAYLGEVARQMFGGEWYAEGDHGSWRLYFKYVYLAFNPIGLAREAITMTEAEGWHAHFELDPGEREIIEERLAAIPEVDEEEYYLPSTRLEVLTIAVETLRAIAEKGGTGDVRFEPEDYD